MTDNWIVFRVFATQSATTDIHITEQQTEIFCKLIIAKMHYIY